MLQVRPNMALLMTKYGVFNAGVCSVWLLLHATNLTAAA